MLKEKLNGLTILSIENEMLEKLEHKNLARGMIFK